MIAKNIKKILKTIPKDVCLVAATKYVTAEEMRHLLPYGICNFGENRVDAFLQKYEALQGEAITWHFIGHLQRNKAVEVVSKIDYLHSLDSLALAKIIQKERTSPLKCFVEVNLNGQDSKNGISPSELKDFLNALMPYDKIEVVGLMMMTNQYSSQEEKKKQFEGLGALQHQINQELNLTLSGLSMGMSEDYLEAIAARATHIRLGRILWTQEN